MSAIGDAKVESKSSQTPAETQLRANLQQAVDYCLAILKEGSPSWPKFAAQKSVLSTKIYALRQTIIELRQTDVQTSYLRLLTDNPDLDQDQINGILDSSAYQCASCAANLFKTVDQIVAAGTGGDEEIAYLIFYMIKSLFPNLRVQSCNMNNYRHDFMLVKKDNLELVVDVVAHGFNQPVIYPRSELDKNLTAMVPNLISKIANTDVSFRVNITLKPGVALVRSAIVDAIVAKLQAEARAEEIKKQLAENSKRLKELEAKKAEVKAEVKKELELRKEVEVALDSILAKKFGQKQSCFYEAVSKSYRWVSAELEQKVVNEICNFFNDNGIPIKTERKKEKRRFIINDTVIAVAKIKALNAQLTAAAVNISSVSLGASTPVLPLSGPTDATTNIKQLDTVQTGVTTIVESSETKATNQSVDKTAVDKATAKARCEAAEAKVATADVSKIKWDGVWTPGTQITEPLEPEAEIFLSQQLVEDDINFLIRDHIDRKLENKDCAAAKIIIAERVRFFRAQQQKAKANSATQNTAVSTSNTAPVVKSPQYQT